MGTPLQRKKQLVEEFHRLIAQSREEVAQGFLTVSDTQNRLAELGDVYQQFRRVSVEVEEDAETWGMVDKRARVLKERKNIEDEYNHAMEMLRWHAYDFDEYDDEQYRAMAFRDSDEQELAKLLAGRGTKGTYQSRTYVKQPPEPENKVSPSEEEKTKKKELESGDLATGVAKETSEQTLVSVDPDPREVFQAEIQRERDLLADKLAELKESTLLIEEALARINLKADALRQDSVPSYFDTTSLQPEKPVEKKEVRSFQPGTNPFMPGYVSTPAGIPDNAGVLVKNEDVRLRAGPRKLQVTFDEDHDSRDFVSNPTIRGVVETPGTTVETSDPQITEMKTVTHNPGVENAARAVGQPVSSPPMDSGMNSSLYGTEDPVKYITKIPIPKFDGNKRKFADWWAAFEAMIDQPKIPAQVKMLKLKECLTGEAADCILGFGYTETGFTTAKTRLKRKYGGSQRKVAIACDELTNFKSIRDNNARDLERLAELLDRLVLNLSASGDESELGAGYLYNGILKKLTPTFLSRYHRWIYESSIQGNVLNLREFVDQESEFLTTATESVHGFQQHSTSDKKKEKTGVTSGRAMATATGKNGGNAAGFRSGKRDPASPVKRECKLCRQNHGIWECAAFRKLKLEDKKLKLKELRLCSKCLGPHAEARCWRKKPCTVTNCQEFHHYLLHPSDSGSSERQSGNAKQDNDSSSDSTSSVTTEEKKSVTSTEVQTNVTSLKPRKRHGTFLSFRTIPVLLSNGNRTVRVNALLDDASDRSYISEQVASYLGLEGEEEELFVNTVVKKLDVVPSKEVTCVLEDDARTLSVFFTAKTLERISEGIEVMDLSTVGQEWDHLAGIDFPKPAGKQIDCLIGLDYADLMGSIKDVMGGFGRPSARLTPLGWTCVASLSRGSRVFVQVTQTRSANHATEKFIRRFWEIEEIGQKAVVMTPDEKKALDIVTKSCRKIDGRFCVGMPWRQKPPEDYNNYDMALRRLISTENKLLRAPHLGASYQGVFNDYKAANYIRKVIGANLREKGVLYLAHFPVIREEGTTTTPTRPVYDASARYKGLSLNDLLLPGPKLQKCLVDVLVKFRRNRYGLVSDVKQMYLQILMEMCDKPFHRFIWRDLDQSKEPEVYEFNRVIFGSNASPFIAQFIARVNAEQWKEAYPRATEMILDKTYMDDGLDSVHEIEEGIQLVKDVDTVWGHAGMSVHKWISNAEEILKSIPEEKRGKKIDLTRHEIPKTKTLGIWWDPVTDTLFFSTDIDIENVPSTKRTFLSLLATIFDPLGLLSPVVIVGKILLQECWMTGLDWDETLPEKLQVKIKKWVVSLPDMIEIKIPRMLVPGSDFLLSLHMFGDSSDDAYGAVVYIVAKKEDEPVYRNIVASKTKVAPLVKTNLPRLELQAAMVGSILLKKVAAALDISEAYWFCWTDSMDVWYWVHGASREYKPYVANRVGEIHRNTEPRMWKYVPSKENPADILSRGMDVRKLKDSKLWLQGPEFLAAESSEWPEMPGIHGEAKERRSCTVTTMMAMIHNQYTEINRSVKLENLGLDPGSWSDLDRLLRVTARVLRAVHKLRGRTISSEFLTAQELRDVKLLYYREHQKKSFPKELRALIMAKEVSSDSDIFHLNPCLDEDGLIRSSTRLVDGDAVPWDTKFPIILNRDDDFTRLLLMSIHEKNGHAGPSVVLSEFLTEHWMLRARETARNVIGTCMKCKRWSAKKVQPAMAPLPSDRAGSVTVAFSKSSVDYAGPFITKVGRGQVRKKNYLCVYCCMHTRAIHLEVATDMSAQAFLMAFTRIVARRGKPETVWSDNGSNFVGANDCIQALQAIIHSEEVQNTMASWNIEWRFNPPLAPHFNGVHEVMVRSAKRALYKIVGNADLTYEELTTVTCDVERVINTRPLTYISSDAKDPTPLTPNHFLIGRINPGVVDGSVAEKANSLQIRWRQCQELVGVVWKRWLREWITSLSPRQKWIRAGEELKVNDVVLLIDPNIQRGKWPLGRIVAVFPGRDGVVRVVDVESRGVILRRPAVKVCRLVPS